MTLKPYAIYSHVCGDLVLHLPGTGTTVYRTLRNALNGVRDFELDKYDLTFLTDIFTDEVE